MRTNHPIGVNDAYPAADAAEARNTISPGEGRTMRTLRQTTSLLLLLFAAWVGIALAQQPASAEALVITAENLTATAEAARGAPRADDGIRPGDLIRYTLTFTNPTDGPVSNVVLHNPFPGGLHLVASSVRASRGDARVEYSIDGGATFSAQPMVETVEAGQTVRRPATPEEYTDIRWTVEGTIRPGEQVSASYELRVPTAEQNPNSLTHKGR